LTGWYNDNTILEKGKILTIASQQGKRVLKKHALHHNPNNPTCRKYDLKDNKAPQSVHLFAVMENMLH